MLFRSIEEQNSKLEDKKQPKNKSINTRRLQEHITKLKSLPKYEYWNNIPSQAFQDIPARIAGSYSRHVSVRK